MPSTAHIQLIATIVAAASAFFLLIQVWMARHSIQDARKRDQVRNTIDFMYENRTTIRDIHRDFLSQFDRGTFDILNYEDAKKIKDDPDLRFKISQMLAFIELLAIGVKRGAFDREIIFDAYRTNLMSAWGFYYAYIELIRTESPYAYIEYESLVLEFQILCGRKGLELPNRYKAYLKRFTQ